MGGGGFPNNVVVPGRHDEKNLQKAVISKDDDQNKSWLLFCHLCSTEDGGMLCDGLAEMTVTKHNHSLCRRTLQRIGDGSNRLELLKLLLTINDDVTHEAHT